MKMVLLFLLFNFNFGFSQTITKNNFGISTGVVLNFGTHVHSVGLSFKTYYSDYFYQFNAGSTVTWNFKSYADRSKFWESRTYLGVVLLGGKKDNSIDFQMDGLMHQTNFRNGIGFNYLWYYDQKGTSQLSGGWSVHANKIGIYFENDVFGGQANDRFRTGHLMVSYRVQNYKFGSGIYLWTGETNGAQWKKNDSLNYKYGYKDLSELPYGKTSHGILYGFVNGNLGYGQYANVELGVDSEKIRNSIQNKLIHDLKFLPKKIERKTPNYPMLDQNGLPIKDSMQVRDSRFYFQAGVNENWSN